MGVRRRRLGCGRIEDGWVSWEGVCVAGIGQWRSRLSRSYYGFFFPFYIRGYGITVGWFSFFLSPSSKTELRASKQYCFLDVPPFTVLSAPQKLCVGWGVGRISFRNTSILTCFHLHPLTHFSQRSRAEPGITWRYPAVIKLVPQHWCDPLLLYLYDRRKRGGGWVGEWWWWWSGGRGWGSWATGRKWDIGSISAG